MRRGDIYLVDFGQSRRNFEFGKNRPAVIVQTDKLNFAIEEEIYDYVIVAPLSTREDIVTEEFRYKLLSRNDLYEESYVVCNSLCFLHKKYLKKKLVSLRDHEIEEINEILRSVLEL